MAKYRFEDLDDIQFQKLCQAIALLSNPDLQVLPTRQRDGGFDAFELAWASGTKAFAVQVKWVADQRQERDPVKWFEDVVAAEESNIRRMVKQGTERWTLMTNVPGTSYPDSGTIDRLNASLHKYGKRLGLEMRAWWREDISRRLDNATWQTKLAYPDMLVGFDAMRAVLSEAFKSGDRERLLDVIRAACRVEWATDRSVRFKHGELDGVALQDVFLDVAVQRTGSELRSQSRESSVEVAIRGGENGNSVFYGAPGQGKSTLSILLAQLHRSKLIGEPLPMEEEFGNLVDGRERVPFRAELKDYALWLSGKDPLDAAGLEKRPKGAGTSIESFVVHVVASRSGGRQFTVDDLASVIDWLPVSFILDGLDEVGDPEVREKVVNEVDQLVRRYPPTTTTVVVQLTTRPNYSGAAEPTADAFAFYELQPLDADQRYLYLNKWSAATNLNPSELTDLRRVYKQRIDEPHVNELATNPMQLAILLSLMHRRGQSIPANRTALYKSYMEFFLDRESVTDPTVKKYRAQLEAITAYLGWWLHLDAESGGSGRASRGELIRRIKHYLVDIGEEPSVAEALFTAVTQRVWVLSGRTEGAFEFDVQPIREYFAARHLFDTAPAKSDGDVLDRLDRLRALFPYPFWINVARFMAGMFTRGEVSGIADAVIDDIETRTELSGSRRLGRTLIDDGVFDDAPRARVRVIEAVHDDLGLILLTTVPRLSAPQLFPGAPSSTAIAEHLRRGAMGTLDSLSRARARLLAGYRDVDTEPSRASWWVDVLKTLEDPGAARRWLGLMSSAQNSGDSIPLADAERLFARFPETAPELLAIGANARRSSPLESAQVEVAIAATDIESVGRSLAADLLYVASPGFLGERYPVVLPDDEVAAESRDGASLRRLRQRRGVVTSITESLRRRAGSRENSLPWSQLANAIFEIYGRSWLPIRVAIDGIAHSGRTLGTAQTDKQTDAFGENGHPSALMAQIRKNAENEEWWFGRAADANDELDFAALLLGAVTCTSPSTLIRLLAMVNALSAKLQANTLQAVAWAAKGIIGAGGVGTMPSVSFAQVAPEASPAAKAFVVMRGRYDEATPVFRADEVRALADVPTLHAAAANSCWLHARLGLRSPDDLVVLLAAAGPEVALSQIGFRFSPEDADAILSGPAEFPAFAVFAAAESRPVVERSPIGLSAEKWFALSE